ncbi:MAG: glycine--tRNA ligase subunit beta [Acidiferrobacterales bacterium]
MSSRSAKVKGHRGRTLPAGDSLLVELLTEELPPKSLQRLADAFAAGVMEGLGQNAVLLPDSTHQVFATPRRLAVVATGVLERQPDRIVERRGPPVGAGYDPSGKPTPALCGFARSCGVEPDSLERCSGEKGEYFVYRSKQKGEPLDRLLAAIVEASLKKLPAAKLMRWGSGEVEFVRPVHGLVMMRGTRVVTGEVFGLRSGKVTMGHRFLSPGKLTIPHAGRYADTLRRKGYVIASFPERRREIERKLRKAAEKVRNGSLVLDGDGATARFPGEEWGFAAEEVIRINAELLNEVAALVEWPVVYAGRFDQDFLSVPIPCLALSMQHHQRYFPLVHGQAARGMLPRFLVVSNMQTRTPRHIIHGNERVLRARLSDARFFYEQDRKTRLEDRVPKLASVVYQSRLGSQLDRVHRLEKLAGGIAGRLGMPDSDRRDVERAAHLCKADLLTEMVGEFPELQGYMGADYARHDGESAGIEQAIRGHYSPRFSGDRLPPTDAGVCLALADKLDTLVGIYGVGLVPTGDKDPFGLRRQALGIVRILVERPLSLDPRELLALARGNFNPDVVSESVDQELLGFLMERLKPYLRDKGFLSDEIDAVLSLGATRLDQLVPRLEALQAFRRLPEAEALASANKRIRNILRQAGAGPAGRVAAGLLTEGAEQRLAQQMGSLRTEVEDLIGRGDFTEALKRLAGLRIAVDEYFDEVMIMVEDVHIRDNRLALLNELGSLFLGAADISKLQARQRG